MFFIIHEEYSRKEIWNTFFEFEEYPSGGDWFTGYAVMNNFLFIFTTVGISGQACNDPQSIIDEKTGILEWYGKPDAHSAQNNFQKLLTGELIPVIFLRYDASHPKFHYFGEAKIHSYYDNKKMVIKWDGIEVAVETININFLSTANGIPGKLIGVDEFEYKSEEGGKILISINKYERDPKLRREALVIHGTVCAACGFDFELVYGELGKGYCHIHHKKPLGEVNAKMQVNPRTDLIPLCANCHAMIHRSVPALNVSELIRLIKSN